MDGVDPNRVAVDETVIQFNYDRYWLYTAVNADTNRLLHAVSIRREYGH